MVEYSIKFLFDKQFILIIKILCLQKHNEKCQTDVCKSGLEN